MGGKKIKSKEGGSDKRGNGNGNQINRQKGGKSEVKVKKGR